MKNIHKSESLFLKLSIGVILIGGFLMFIISIDRLVDEKYHATQAKRLYKHNIEFVENLTTIPGYHYTLAFIGKLTNPIINYDKHPKIRSLRIFQLTLALFFPMALFLIIRELNQKKEITLIFTLTPIIFPFLFLIYTDALSLTLFLIAFLFHLKKRYDLAAIFIILDIVVRQDNIIWLGFLIILLLYELYIKHGKQYKKIIYEFFLQGLGYLIVSVAFLMFYVFNKGIAIGDKTAHPSMNFHLDNIWLFFAMFGFLFLPLLLGNLKDIWQFFTRKWMLSIIFIILGYALFMTTFIVDHPYNTSVGDYIHNAVAYNAARNSIFGASVYILTLLAVGYIIVQKFIKKIFILVVPFLLLALSLHWMVEFRYFFIPMALLLLTLNHDNRMMRYQIIYSGVLTVILFYILFISESMFL